MIFSVEKYIKELEAVEGEMLGTSESTIRNMIHRGDLRCVRLGSNDRAAVRVTEDEVNRLLTEPPLNQAMQLTVEHHLCDVEGCEKRTIVEYQSLAGPHHREWICEDHSHAAKRKGWLPLYLLPEVEYLVRCLGESFLKAVGWRIQLDGRWWDIKISDRGPCEKKDES